MRWIHACLSAFICTFWLLDNSVGFFFALVKINSPVSQLLQYVPVPVPFAEYQNSVIKLECVWLRIEIYLMYTWKPDKYLKNNYSISERKRNERWRKLNLMNDQTGSNEGEYGCQWYCIYTTFNRELWIPDWKRLHLKTLNLPVSFRIWFGYLLYTMYNVMWETFKQL